MRLELRPNWNVVTQALAAESREGPGTSPGSSHVRFSVICLSPQDWYVDLPTNRQQIMRRVAARGHEVLFVETGHFLGKQLWQLGRRGTRASLARRLLATERAGPRLRVRRAVNVLPWGHRLASRVNAAASSTLLRRLARRLPHPVVLWIYDPCFASLVGGCGEAFAVYDCIDDFAAMRSDRRRKALVAEFDELAARRSRVVFATTRHLFGRHRRLNPNTHHAPNVADYEHFAPAADRSLAAPEVERLAQPIIGFAGNFLRGRVDSDLLEMLARARPQWTLLLIGPSRPGTEEPLSRLTSLPNVTWLGPKPYERLPRYVAAFDVGLCPYVWNDWMRSGFPLKLYEYLAAGKPVVASGNPDLAGMEPDVRLARGAEEFVSCVERALELAGDTDRARRRAIAARNTWEARTERLLELVAAELRS